MRLVGHGFGSVTAFILSQSANVFGSGLTRFGINVWIYAETGSFSIFFVLTLLSTLPVIVAAPFAGLLVDAMPRRRLLILVDVIAFVPIAALGLTALAGHVGIWLAMAAVTIGAVVDSIHWPAYGATIAQIVPAAKLGRVNGIIQAGQSISSIAAPAVAAALYAVGGLPILIGIDGVIVVVSVITLLWIRVPAWDKAEHAEEKSNVTGAGAASFSKKNLLEGFRWIAERRDLRRLLIMFAVGNFFLTLYGAACIPYYLSFLPLPLFGMIESINASGLVVAGLVVAAFDWPRKRGHAVALGWFTIGMTVMGTAVLLHSFTLLAICSFLSSFSIVIINSSSQTIWQRTVPLDLQGRIFALRRAVAWGATPLALILAVPFANRVIEPLTQTRAFDATRLDHLWSEPDTATLGMLMIACGAMICVVTAALGRVITQAFADLSPELVEARSI